VSSTKAPTIDYDRRYIRTHSGGKFFALEPEHGDIRIEDIAQGLANSCRWGGQCKFWYPVAAHAIWVSLVLPKPLKLCGLLHDASEGMGLADIASPFKAFLPDYKKIEDTAMGGIARKFGFEWPVPPEVKKADMLALYHERKALFDAPIRLDKATIPMLGLPKGWKLPCWRYDNWTPEKAKQLFLDYYERYVKDSAFKVID
jgi:uncharacterized protein